MTSPDLTLRPGPARTSRTAPAAWAVTVISIFIDSMMATGWPGGPLMDIGSKAYADKVAELSDGRIKIQVFPGGALGNALKVSETVKNGVAELGHTWMGYDWGADTTTVLFGGYAGSMDTERMLHWIYEGGGLELQRQYRDEKFGVYSNLALVDTDIEEFVPTGDPMTMNGVAKTTGTLDLWYADHGFEARLGAKYHSTYTVLYGWDSRALVRVEPETTLDFSASYNVNSRVAVRFQVGNLLDTPLRTYNDNKEHRLGRLDYYGRRFLFDVTVKY